MDQTSWYVGIAARDGWNGGGRLTIRTGELALTPSRVMRAVSTITPLIHTTKRVDVYTARLVPPWINTGMPLFQDRSRALVSVPGFRRRRLVELLQQAGFEVVEHRTWINCGRHQDAPAN